MTSPKHVVLGAGPLGTTLAAALAEDGVEASLLSIMGNPLYDAPGTSPRSVDGTDVDLLSKHCADAEVLYLCLNAHYVDWYGLFPPRLRAAIEVAERVGATLVYHDNVYMYGPIAGELTEDTPSSASTRKGRLRAQMATALVDAVRSGRIRGVIGRSADMYGPGALNSSFNSTLGERHFYPLLAGRAVNIVGDIDAPHTYAYLDDVARGLIVLASEHRQTTYEVFHLPAAPTLSHRELMTIAFAEGGRRPKIRGSKISGHVVRAIGRFQPDVREVAEMLYQFEKPLVVSHERFEHAFGASPTPHASALEQTLAWYREHPP